MSDFVRVWKDVVGYDDYEVSSIGEVRRKSTGLVLAEQFGDYICVRLFRDGKQHLRKIHRLVAKAFLKNPDNLRVVDHIDNVKYNNDVSNLRWASYRDNSIAYWHNHRKERDQPILQYDMDDTFVKKWKNMDEIIKEHPEFKRRTIYKCTTNEKPSAYKFKWKIPEVKLHKNERFKTIGIFEGKDLSQYKVSNYGKVKNKHDNYVKSRKTGGYLCISLYNGTTRIRNDYRIHRLVAFKFVTGYSKGKVVNHKDKKSCNNYYKNLEWVTQSENITHSHGKAVNMLDKDTGEIIKTFKCIHDAYVYLGKEYSTYLGRCCDSNRIHYGYKWSLA